VIEVVAPVVEGALSGGALIAMLLAMPQKLSHRWRCNSPVVLSLKATTTLLFDSLP
jgi:hypothetical protein